MKIGFIGLGKMGRWMAKNIMNAGYSLVVYNRSEKAVQELAAQGAEPGKSPLDVAERCELVIIAPPPPAVEEVVFGKLGVLDGCRKGHIIANCANSNPADDVIFAARCLEKGVHFLDVGISGAPEGARDGSLALMAGGERAAYEKARDVLLAMGSVIEYFGPTGSGHLVKTVNNMLVIMNMVCAAEAIHFAKRCGLDERMVLRVITKGLAGSKVLDHAKNYFDKDPKDRTTSQEMIKKLGKGNHITWAQDIAREKGIYLPMSALANEAYLCASEDKGNTEYDNNINILRGIRRQTLVESAEDKNLKTHT
jgi:3-hydroxyisobutyrate dehydrogenase-like beta-hydroxyacid dehydrogenase